MNRKQIADKIDKQLEEIERYERNSVDLPASVYREISTLLRHHKGPSE